MRAEEERRIEECRHNPQDDRPKVGAKTKEQREAYMEDWNKLSAIPDSRDLLLLHKPYNLPYQHRQASSHIPFHIVFSLVLRGIPVLICSLCRFNAGGVTSQSPGIVSANILQAQSLLSNLI